MFTIDTFNLDSPLGEKSGLAAALLVSATALTVAPVAAQQLDPSTQAFVDGLQGSPPIYTLAPDAARAVLSGAQKSVKVTLLEVSSQDRVLNVGPKGRTNYPRAAAGWCAGHVADRGLCPWRRLGAGRQGDA